MKIFQFHLFTYLFFVSVEVLKRVDDLIVADLDTDSFTKEKIAKLVKNVGKEYKLKTPVIMKLMRMAVSGLSVSLVFRIFCCLNLTPASYNVIFIMCHSVHY